MLHGLHICSNASGLQAPLRSFHLIGGARFADFAVEIAGTRRPRHFLIIVEPLLQNVFSLLQHDARNMLSILVLLPIV